ncbi:hypothetical protein CAEBREN_16298 [Caenorhabditis brenneri]|uniref:G-protein coupled receptors family 1 profile domain-containing protein n=1 Tax=Caenorhabditis brenneri TaxID=135651 RepID=G0NEG2_CAEBE|nr:hypothetical protein CAEBREN_16298 [Caenorhabditis brenneri]
MSLIYLLFVVDMMYSLASFSSLTYFLIRIDYPNIHIKNLTFFLAWPTLNLGSIHAILVFIISCDRVFVSCFPLFYHNHRSKVPNFIIFTVILMYTLFEQFVLWKICDFVLDIPPSCLQLGCSINTCYRGYWTYFEQVAYFFIGVVSVVLCFRLFIWNHCTKTKPNRQMSKVSEEHQDFRASLILQATWLSLLTSFMTFTFDALPFFLLIRLPEFTFETVGPLSAAGKYLGLVIEVMIICKVLIPKKSYVGAAIPLNNMN